MRHQGHILSPLRTAEACRVAGFLRTAGAADEARRTGSESDTMACCTRRSHS